MMVVVGTVPAEVRVRVVVAAASERSSMGLGAASAESVKLAKSVIGGSGLEETQVYACM